jgi:hypothetical protein
MTPTTARAPSTFPVVVAIAPGGVPGSDELEITYDGTTPPLDLFDALAQVGWTRPIAAPPPRSAIDWSHADPSRGTRFTVRPYPATSHATLPRPGADRRAVELAMAVARRHGAEVPPEFADVDGAATEGATAGPAIDLVDGRSRAGSATVTVVLPDAQVDAMLEGLDDAATLTGRTATIVRRENTYRGQVCETEIAATAVELRVNSALLDEVATVLSQIAIVAPVICAATSP